MITGCNFFVFNHSLFLSAIPPTWVHVAPVRRTQKRSLLAPLPRKTACVLPASTSRALIAPRVPVAQVVKAVTVGGGGGAVFRIETLNSPVHFLILQRLFLLRATTEVWTDHPSFSVLLKKPVFWVCFPGTLTFFILSIAK